MKSASQSRETGLLRFSDKSKKRGGESAIFAAAFCAKEGQRCNYGAKYPEISTMRSVVVAAKRLKAPSLPSPTVKWRLKIWPLR